jgi:hypothetical protein
MSIEGSTENINSTQGALSGAPDAQNTLNVSTSLSSSESGAQTASAPLTSASASAPSVSGQTTSEVQETFYQKLSKLYIWIQNNSSTLLIPGLAIVLLIFLVGLFINLIYPFTKSKKKPILSILTSEETKEENSKQVKINEVEKQLEERITNINTNLTALKKKMDESDIIKDNKPTNLAIAIQNNILAVKEAMMKMIAGLVIQTKMNNGALNVVSQTNAFQQDIIDISKSLTNSNSSNKTTK